MKTVVLFCAFLFSTSAFAAKTSIKTDVIADGEIVYSLNYFKDSSFWGGRYSVQACYQGNLNEACKALKKDFARNAYEYRNGAHDLMELESCAIHGLTVLVDYRLSDDYNVEPVKKQLTIPACRGF